MAEWRYAPGGRAAIVAGRLAMLFDGPGADDAAAAALAVTGAEPDLESVLDAVLQRGMPQLPALFIAEFAGRDLTAVLRGAIAVEAETADGARHAPDGAGLRTWREFALDDVVRLRVGAAADADAQSGSQPAYVGRLSVSRLEWHAETGAFPTTAVAAPQPTTAGTDAADPAHTLDFFDREIAVSPAPPTPVPPPVPPAPGPDALDPSYSDTIRYTSPPGIRRPVETADEFLDESSAALTGVVCPAGHGNPLERETCARCGAALRGAAVRRVARPELGTVTLPDGSVLPLRGTLLIGRSPRGDRVATGDVPILVTVDDKDVSRTHVRVHSEGWQVLIEDLGSTNGTTLALPGAHPRRIRAGEPALVADGAVAELGTNTRLTFAGVP